MIEKVESTKCYAVTSGEYSAYDVHAIYRRREDAETRVEISNAASTWLIDGEISTSERDDLPPLTINHPSGPKTIVDWGRVKDHPDKLPADARVEEFDYFEGEPLPAKIKEPTS